MSLCECLVAAGSYIAVKPWTNMDPCMVYGMAWNKRTWAYLQSSMLRNVNAFQMHRWTHLCLHPLVRRLWWAFLLALDEKLTYGPIYVKGTLDYKPNRNRKPEMYLYYIWYISPQELFTPTAMTANFYLCTMKLSKISLCEPVEYPTLYF